jgi:hypothetical protein
MAKVFYNTTGEVGTTLADFTVAAEEQQARILEYAKKNRDLIFTSEDLAFLFRPNTPITSIRRAVCNLKKAKEIQVVGRKMGMFNHPIFAYQYCGKVSASVSEDSKVQN